VRSGDALAAVELELDRGHQAVVALALELVLGYQALVAVDVSSLQSLLGFVELASQALGLLLGFVELASPALGLEAITSSPLLAAPASSAFLASLRTRRSDSRSARTRSVTETCRDPIHAT